MMQDALPKKRRLKDIQVGTDADNITKMTLSPEWDTAVIKTLLRERKNEPMQSPFSEYTKFSVWNVSLSAVSLVENLERMVRILKRTLIIWGNRLHSAIPKY